MDYTDQIKALQRKAGIEVDGVASSKTWIAIYHMLCASIPYDINVTSIIKAIQQRINVRVSGYPSQKTLDVLHQLLVGDEEAEAPENTGKMDPTNEIILKSMTKEVVPFAKELIRLAAEKGIHIRLMGRTADDGIEQTNEASCNHNFGLVFEIKIYEKNPAGEYSYKDHSPLYAEVAKLGASIGLTWAGDRKTFSNLPQFELRPAWAVTMKETEMVKELCRRKRENINLLAIL